MSKESHPKECLHCGSGFGRLVNGIAFFQCGASAYHTEDTGWVPFVSRSDNCLLFEIYQLRKENDALKAKLVTIFGGGEAPIAP